MLVNRKELTHHLGISPSTIKRLEMQGVIEPEFNFRHVYRYDPERCLLMLKAYTTKPRCLRSLRGFSRG